MIARIILLLLAWIPMSASLEAGWWENLASYFKTPVEIAPPTIKVLIAHDKLGTILEVNGKYRIIDPHTGEQISYRFAGKRKVIQAIADGLKWGEEFPGIHQILIVPDDQNVTTWIDGVQYSGSIYVYDIGGSISVVNETYVEDFLASTLASNYPELLPSEAFAAVAIAARTDAYYRIANPGSKFWDVDGIAANYRGITPLPQTEATENILHETRYMVMSQKSNADTMIPFPAQWSFARIPLQKAVEMANQGENAAQILMKAFPNTRIELLNYATLAGNR